jgi:DNA helicase-2/ATP-dependent DNA helicase PcrA
MIGQHRVAYLLSSFINRAKPLSASQIVTFGPTKAFLSYVSDLLPSLNIRDVRQVTVAEWLAGTLSVRVRLNRRRPLVEAMLAGRSGQGERAVRAARLKGSMQMVRLLTNHVDACRRRDAAAMEDLWIEAPPGRHLTLNATDMRVALRSLPDGPLNVKRERAIGRFLELLWGVAVAKSPVPEATGGEARRAFFARVRDEVERQVSNFWPRRDFRVEYRAALMEEAGADSTGRYGMDADDVRSLAPSLPKGPAVFGSEDLAPLAYMDALLNDPPPTGFQHVVVDEAQEVTPFELTMIRRHAQDAGFTILGDIAQSLSPHGHDGLAAVSRLFKGSPISRFTVRTTYRATDEIVQVANRLARVLPRTALIQTVGHGEAPIFEASRSYAAMVDAIARDINRYIDRNLTVAVLCKTVAEAKKLSKDLGSKTVPTSALLSADADPGAGVIVGPGHLARGMEFDAVILANAGGRNYPPSELHRRLLFLAVTRANHFLCIHWFGPAPRDLLPHAGRATIKKETSGRTRRGARSLTATSG